ARRMVGDVLADGLELALERRKMKAGRPRFPRHDAGQQRRPGLLPQVERVAAAFVVGAYALPRRRYGAERPDNGLKSEVEDRVGGMQREVARTVADASHVERCFRGKAHDAESSRRIADRARHETSRRISRPDDGGTD